MQKSRVFPPLFHRNFFHKESTLFLKNLQKLVRFLWIPHCIHAMSRLFESTSKKVDSLGTTGIFHLISFRFNVKKKGALAVCKTKPRLVPFFTYLWFWKFFHWKTSWCGFYSTTHAGINIYFFIHFYPEYILYSRL